MPNVQLENALQPMDRKQDISLWQEPDISKLKSREKKRYHKCKSAIKAYFTTGAPLEKITSRYHIPTSVLLNLAEKCLMQHADGTPWGFRALHPRVQVIDHTPHTPPPQQEVVPPGEDRADLDKEESTGVEASSSVATPEDSTMPIAETVHDEKEYDTGEYQAITPALPDSSFDANVPGTPLPPVLEDSTTAQEEPPGEELTVADEAPGEEHEAQEVEEIPASAETEEEHEAQEVEEILASTETEEAIAEVERLLKAHEEVDIEDESTWTCDVEEVKQERSRARVTIPIPVVALEPNGHRVTGLVPFLPSGTYRKQAYASLEKKAAQRRLIVKHWQRAAQDKKRHRHFQQILILTVLVALLALSLVPTGAGLAAYSVYNNVNHIVHDGINHLLNVESILHISKSDPTAILNPTKLQQSQHEFEVAESDFVQLQQMVNQPEVQSAISQFAQPYSNKLDMALSLIRAAVDLSRMGKELCGVALMGANIIHGSPLATSSTKPLISPTDISTIEGGLAHALYYIGDIRLQLSHVSINNLPISNAQKAKITSLLPLLPRAEDMITQAQGLIGPVSWLLGVGQQRRFLVQTMDTAELRPGGGFTGDYGILQIYDGRMSHLSLTDVTLLDYAGNGSELGRTAPAAYGWMTFPNFGLRDANLSGDFPTTARLALQVFQDEGGGPIDGDIAFTPVLIGHILDETGPLKVPAYNETITSKNLEDRLHYYQQDFSAIAREKQISGNYSHSGRKAFASTLAQLLLDRVRHLPMNKLIVVAKGVIKDIQSRDLEIYFTNPVVESWLVEHGYSDSIDTFSQQDGFMVVQGNYSISKASQYVHTTLQDQVQFDAQGNATHNLTITLDYQQKGPVYGYDTYADYIRVYAPQSATFISGDGFDSGHLLCNPGPPGNNTGPTAPVSGCGQYNSFFPSDTRYCPNGNYSLGIEWGTTPWPIDSIGPPTEMKSDLPGRAMWGGMTLTPKNCISYITLSWVVPHAVRKVHGQPSYTILVQKQSGVTPTIELTIDASAIKGLPSFQFTGDITVDKAFTLVPRPPKK